MQHLKPLPGSEIAKKNSSIVPKNGDIRRVLGIDPGIASTGWAVVDFYKNRYACIAYGVIETKPSQIHGERLLMIFDKIEEIIQSYKPREAAMETLYFSKNVSSAMKVSEARGVVHLCLSKNHLICGEYTPLIIKKTITGSQKAKKTDIQDYLKLLLGLQEKIEPDHASDALACAITHLHSGFSIY